MVVGGGQRRCCLKIYEADFALRGGQRCLAEWGPRRGRGRRDQIPSVELGIWVALGVKEVPFRRLDGVQWGPLSSRRLSNRIV